MNEAIDEAEKSMGETEIREANLKKAEYLSRIGDKVRLTDVLFVSVSFFLMQCLKFFGDKVELTIILFLSLFLVLFSI